MRGVAARGLFGFFEAFIVPSGFDSPPFLTTRNDKMVILVERIIMRNCTSHAALTVCLLAGLFNGCTIVGPEAVHSGRLSYNEAIIQTDNQQMLLLAVRGRYGERSNLLSVDSITANVTVRANAGVEAGVGDSDNYAGNLVPISAGVSYEENPTISYSPVGGEQYAHELMSPVSVTSLAQFTSNLVDPAPVYYALVSSINGIYNPDFLNLADAHDERFDRVVRNMTKLSRAHRLNWVQDPRGKDRFSIVISHYSPDYTDEVSELLTLLGLGTTKHDSARIALPVSLALDGRNTGGIGITTRSVYQLLEILSGAVEVPEQDKASGVAVNYPAPGSVGKHLHVHFSKSKPDHAFVAVRYRDGWYYIDEKDRISKQYFRLLATLLSINIAENAGRGSSAPVLTVPVSH